MGKGGGQSGGQQPVYAHDQNAINQQNQIQQQQFYQAQLEANRNRAMQQGRVWGQSMFAHGSMPRLQEGRSQEQSDLLANRRAISDVAGQYSAPTQNILSRYQQTLGGYTSPQYDAARAQAYKGFQQQGMTDQRNLLRAQGNNFVSGPAAAAQIARLGAAQSANAADAEQKIMLANIGNQQQQLNAYNQANQQAESDAWNRQQQALGAQEQTQGNIENWERQAQQYNNQQYNRETAGQMQSMLGMMGMSQGDLASAAQSAIAAQQMNQAMNQGNQGSGKK